MTQFEINIYLSKPSILDMMCHDIDDIDEEPHPSTERDYAQDEPPAIQRIVDAPMHSTSYQDPPTLSARPGPMLLPPRPQYLRPQRQ